MEGILNNLSLATYNCRGFKSSMPDVQKLLNDYQIIFLQETWLAKHGRGQGGTAIYYILV